MKCNYSLNSERKKTCRREKKKQIHKKPQTNIWSNLCGLLGLGVMVVGFCWGGLTLRGP